MLESKIKYAYTRLGTFAMLAMPRKRVTTQLINALHFRRGVCTHPSITALDSKHARRRHRSSNPNPRYREC